MGRRSEHTPEGLRSLIIEASERIIVSDGLTGLSAREIARAVGYSPGTIYNIFDSLDDLILQVEARLLDDLDARLAELPKDGPAHGRVLRLAREYLAFTSERPRLWNLLFEHHLPAAVPVPDWYQHKLNALLQHVEDVLKPMIAHAEPAIAARSARVLWAGVHGITSLATADKLSSITSETAQAMVDDLVKNYLAGLEHLRLTAAA
ncbi:MAG: TetR/AcrR family transcriptional regulator [Hyphomicrobiaceae bacterium]